MRFLDFAPRLASAAIAVAAIRAAAIPVPAEEAAPEPAPLPPVGEAIPNSSLIFLKPGADNERFKTWINGLIADAATGDAMIADIGDIGGNDTASVNTGGNDTAPANTGGNDTAPANTEDNDTAPVSPVIEKEIKVESANLSVISGTFDDDFVEMVKARPEVAGVFPNLVHSIMGTQVNPANKGLPRISFPTANQTDYFYPDSAGEGVTVYVIDTGIRITHNDFGGRASFGVTTVSGTTDPSDDHGHGTHVSAIVGGASFGVAKKANLVAVKVCSGDGKCTTLDIIEGIFWAMTDARNKPAGKYLANLSLGGSPDAAMDLAVQIAMNAGMPFAVAAGNRAVDACTVSPGRIAGAVTVAALGPQDTKASFSNFGTCVDIVAPGVSILSASNSSDDATATFSGTSMSSPFTAGVLALIAGQNSFTIQQLTDTLVQMGIKNVIQNLSDGTPNLLLYNGGSPDTNTTSTTTSTTTVPTSTTDLPTSATELSTSATDAITSATDAITSTADAPTSTTDTLTSTTDAPTSTTDALTSTTDAPTSTTDGTTLTTGASVSTTDAPTSTADAPQSTTDATTSSTEAVAIVQGIPGDAGIQSTLVRFPLKTSGRRSRLRFKAA